MKKTLISESAIRELVREALDTHPPYDAALILQDEELPVVVNPSVDDSLVAIDVSPVDVQFVPRDKTEFELAIKSMAKNLPDDVIPMLYAKVRETMLDTQEKCDGPEGLGDTEEMIKRDNARLGMHESLRKAIRKILSEEKPQRDIRGMVVDPPEETGDEMLDPAFNTDDEEFPVPLSADNDDRGAPGIDEPTDFENEPTSNGQGLATDDIDIDDLDSDWDPEPLPVSTKKKRHYDTGFSTEYDIDGDIHDKIAKELGISVSGAKRLEATGLGKLQYMMGLDEDDVIDIIDAAAKDYVKYLNKSGELTPDDVKLMLRNTDIVAELDGFRDFLHKYIRKEMQKDDVWGKWWKKGEKEKDDDDSDD